MAGENERSGFVRIDADLGRRLKAVAGLRGQSIKSVLDEIVPAPLDRIERDAIKRYSAGERPVRARPMA
jgi:hypothetical protein